MVNKTGGIDKLSNQAGHNIDIGSSKALVLTECKDVGLGLSNGDFKKATFNGGLLSLYAIPTINSYKGANFGLKASASGAIVRVAAMNSSNNV